MTSCSECRTEAPPFVRLKMEAGFLPDVTRSMSSARFAGEKPDKVVVVGGHTIPDVGPIDRTTAAVRDVEALRLMKAEPVSPPHCPGAWTNEENGTRGALPYRDGIRINSNHVLMLESDSGILHPTRSASPAATPPDAHQGDRHAAARHSAGSDRADW
jgi:hypothetical protein